jgi:periplasmic protein TonB
MKSNILPISAVLAAIAAFGIQPAIAATGTAFTQIPSGAADMLPMAIAQPKPEYSTYLRHADIEGHVVVSFTVTPKGDVINATVVRSTDRLFSEPTLEAVSKWKFKPAMKDGLPVSTRVSELVTFLIPDAPR